MLPFHFHARLFVLLAFGFILFTVVGTLSHELGHCAVAKYLGYEVKLNYASMRFYKSLENGRHLSERPEKDERDDFLVSLGGPLQTIFTGSFAFLILLHCKRRKWIPTHKLPLKYWLLIFLSLFWLRQVANFAMGVYILIEKRRWSLLGDEPKLDEHLNFPTGTTETVTAFIAVILLAYIVFIIIPATQRLTFLIAGLIGGLSGAYLWMVVWGPWLFNSI